MASVVFRCLKGKKIEERIDRAGNRVIGIFKENLLEGEGKKIGPQLREMGVYSRGILIEGTRDRGTFVDDKLEGVGQRIVRHNGQEWEEKGTYVKGLLEGEGCRKGEGWREKGSYYIKNGTYREGRLIDGLKEEGNIINGELEGEGTRTQVGASEWQKFTEKGIFEAGELNGQGSKVWLNGDKEEGNFVKGKLEGEKGTRTRVGEQGYIETGIFKAGKLNGKGV